MLDITKMKAPGDKRPTWRNGIIQIHITRACDLSCIGCTQGSNLAGKPTIMTLENFERACLSLKDYYGVIGIFGGNPTTHPKFEAICRIFERTIPFEQRGLWSNNLRGYGKLCREIFNPAISNLNVHTSREAYDEFKRDWPEANLIGVDDSRHSPPYVAMKDMEDMNQDEMDRAIEGCDINQYWSAMICQFRGELRAFFCEIAGAQSMLHENESDYPDTGLKVTEYKTNYDTRYQWWQLPINIFEKQINKHCYDCGVPLRGYGDLAINGNVEYVSKTHENIYKLKKPHGKLLKVVTKRADLGHPLLCSTDYIANGAKAMQDKVVVGVPTLEMARRASFYDHLIQLKTPVGSAISCSHGQSPAANRNVIIQQALDIEATHVLFLDDDIAFPSDLFYKLRAHDKDIVSALYLMRNYPHQPILFDKVMNDAKCHWMYLTDGMSGLTPMVASGLGACLIKTDVFRRMEKPWVRLGELDKDNWNDDIGFFLRARAAGIKSFCDLDTICGHMASVTIWPGRTNGKWHTAYDTSGTDAVSIPAAPDPVMSLDFDELNAKMKEWENKLDVNELGFDHIYWAWKNRLENEFSVIEEIK